MSSIDHVDDSMMVTGMKMTTNTYHGRHDPANITESSGMRATSGRKEIQGAGMKQSKSGYKIGLRVASNERKSSIGGDLPPGDVLSPYPRIMQNSNLTRDDHSNRVDQAFRNSANQS